MSCLRQRVREHAADFRRLVGIVDLVAADAPADPGDRHALRIAQRRDLVLEGEIARRRRAGVEVLVEHPVRRHDQRADMPVEALRLLAFMPHQREALAGQDDDVRARPVAVRLLVGADRELRDVARHAARHVEADVAAAGAALLGADQRQVDRVGHEIGGEQEALLLRLRREVVRLAVEAVLEVVGRVEDEIDVVIEVHHRRRIGDADIARRLLPRAVEMLVPAVERDREHRARLPLEGDALAGVVPDAGRAAAVEDQDHLLVELALRLELLAGRDGADVAVVRDARGVVVDEDAAAAAARPGLEFHRAQVRHVLRADDVEPLRAHPAQIGRVLLGREFLGEFLGNGRDFWPSDAPFEPDFGATLVLGRRCVNGGRPHDTPGIRSEPMLFGMYAPVPHVTVGSKEITRSVKGALDPLPAGEIDPAFTLAKDVLLRGRRIGLRPLPLCRAASRRRLRGLDPRRRHQFLDQEPARHAGGASRPVASDADRQDGGLPRPAHHRAQRHQPRHRLERGRSADVWRRHPAARERPLHPRGGIPRRACAACGARRRSRSTGGSTR